MADKNWIAGAIKHPGALHKQLGVPAGKDIPQEKLNAIHNKLHKKAQKQTLTEAESKLLHRVNLARTLKSFK